MRGEEPLGPTGLHQCRPKHRTHSQQFGIDNIAECIEEQPISADRLSSERIEFIERKPVRAFPDSPPNPQEFCIDPAELEKDRPSNLNGKLSVVRAHRNISRPCIDRASSPASRIADPP